MKLKVYGSGSSGNSYALVDNEGNALILDAGINARLILKDIIPSKIMGVLVTHEHKDHSGYIDEYRKMFCNILLPDSMGGDVEDGKMFKLGSFSVLALSMNHDVPCYGFAIMHPELNASVFYATDTNGIDYEFEELSLALIEANYMDDILQKNVNDNIVDRYRAKRVKSTHNSINQAIDFAVNAVRRIEHIILIHLSRDNANSEVFKREMEKASGIPTDIATSGLEYKFLTRKGYE